VGGRVLVGRLRLWWRIWFGVFGGLVFGGLRLVLLVVVFCWRRIVFRLSLHLKGGPRMMMMMMRMIHHDTNSVVGVLVDRSHFYYRYSDESAVVV